jgi:hypothetical protein
METSTLPPDIPLLEDILNLYDNGSLVAENSAHRCYLTELHRHLGKVTWIHDDELKNHSILRKLGKAAGRDLMRELRQH